MNQNIELKTRFADHAKAKRILRALGAKAQKPMSQVDTYFHCKTGRLKLREMPDRTELIWYRRPDGSRPRASNYIVVKITDAKGIKIALSSALGLRGVVRKRRQWFLWKNVRIHLDTIQGLGRFIEFEAVIGPKETPAEGHDRIALLCRQLGITKRHVLRNSYVDILGL